MVVATIGLVDRLLRQLGGKRRQVTATDADEVAYQRLYFAQVYGDPDGHQ